MLSDSAVRRKPNEARKLKSILNNSKTQIMNTAYLLAPRTSKTMKKRIRSTIKWMRLWIRAGGLGGVLDG